MVLSLTVLVLVLVSIEAEKITLYPCTDVDGCVCTNGSVGITLLCVLRTNQTFDFAAINLENISVVEIYGEKIKMEESEHLILYPELNILKIQESKIRTVLKKSFLIQFPNIQDLVIKRCSLFDIQMSAFSELKHLRSLDLSQNKNIGFNMVEKGLEELSSPNLRRLNLSLIHNPDESETLPIGRISYKLFKLLANTSLEVLDVSWTRLYFFEASALFIPGLKSFNFSGTALVGSFDCFSTFLITGNLSEIVFDYWPYTERTDSLPIYPNPRYKHSVPEQCEGTSITDQNGCYIFSESLKTVQSQNSRLSTFYIDFSQPVCLDAKGLINWLIAGVDIPAQFSPLSGMTNVKVFDLSYPRFSNAQTYFASIDSAMFHSMPSLEVVLIPGNRLDAMSDSQLQELFVNSSQLQVTDLSSNNLPRLPRNMFVYNLALLHLNLSRNKLTTIEFRLGHIENLQVLDLSYNEIKTLGKPVTETFDTSFYRLRLYLKHNEFQCDCSINNIISMNISVLHMSCNGDLGSETIVKNETITQLDYRECKSNDFTKHISQTVLIISILIPLVILILIGLSVLFYRQRRKKKSGKPLVYFYQKSNAGHLKRNPRFKAFIAFSHTDEYIVLNEIVPKLESHLEELFPNEKDGLLCIYDKHFIPGQPIDEVCEQAVLNSHVLIAVITKAFMDSSWCDFEIKRAYESSIKVIPLYLKECDSFEYKGIFKAMFDEVIRLKWPQNGNKNDKEDTIKVIADAVYAHIKEQEVINQNTT